MDNAVRVTENLYWIGGNDRRLRLFEGTFPVPRGVSYNSYLLLDAETVLFDTVDEQVADVFFEGLEHLLDGRKLDYLVISHMEPDHSASLKRVLRRYPGVKVVANQKTACMIGQYFGEAPDYLLVKEGDTLCTGTHTLKFLFAPMVHWPEVMFTYDEAAGILFSADAFGAFGALGGSIFADENDFWREFLPEARRYYTNIVGKYGVQVQNALNKAAGLDIKFLCSLHGPVWREDIPAFLAKYRLWSAYMPETKGVAVFYASVYGHTQNAAEILASAISARGVSAVKVFDVSACDPSYLVAEAFRFSHLVFASTTYNNGIFVNMERFLSDLAAHNFGNRRYALIENGTWSPQAGKLMEEMLSSMKGMQKIGNTVKILSALKEGDRAALTALAQAVAADVNENAESVE